MAVLAPEQGKIAQTGEPTHYSLWLKDDVLEVAHELFQIVPVEGKK